MEITKEEFITYLTQYKDFDDYLSRLYKLGIDIADNNPIFGMMEKYLTMLEKATHDTGEWISYFCYELDYGAKWQPGYIIDENGFDVNLACMDELWALLEEEYEKDGNSETENGEITVTGKI